MKLKLISVLTLSLLVGAIARAEPQQPLPVAVFDFESKDENVRDLGPKIATLINVNLSADPNLITVERAELDKALGEQELGLSGTVSPDTAAKVGHLTGAKVLVDVDSCPAGKIKQVVGGNTTIGQARARSCVPRP